MVHRELLVMIPLAFRSVVFYNGSDKGWLSAVWPDELLVMAAPRFPRVPGASWLERALCCTCMKGYRSGCAAWCKASLSQHIHTHCTFKQTAELNDWEQEGDKGGRTTVTAKRRGVHTDSQLIMTCVIITFPIWLVLSFSSVPWDRCMEARDTNYQAIHMGAVFSGYPFAHQSNWIYWIIFPLKY